MYKITVIFTTLLIFQISFSAAFPQNNDDQLPTAKGPQNVLLLFVNVSLLNSGLLVEESEEIPDVGEKSDSPKAGIQAPILQEEKENCLCLCDIICKRKTETFIDTGKNIHSLKLGNQVGAWTENDSRCSFR